MVDHAVIEVFPTEVSISGSGLHFENTILDCEERNIEGPATKIEDKHVLLALSSRPLFFVKTVGDSGSRGLVNDTENIETSNGTRILGCLTL
mmetsp:Transcript_25563/g.40389  ORF Transcript_25563/g.40389 Transcript_25563/m.40389 type:complete len:92 (+) Transcript_25563:1276-1551(+)